VTQSQRLRWVKAQLIVTHYATGGGVLFSGVAASNLGMNVEVVTKCSAEDKPVFQKIFAPRCVATLGHGC